MAKIRVYELAKELGLDNKDIMAKLRLLKIPVKSHMSVVPEEDLDRLKKSLAEDDEVTTAGGIEEKRVAKGVIRRRARAPAPQVEEEQPKMDLATLKQAAKRRREEDAAAKPEPEILEGIPEEWAEEAKEPEKAKKKPKKKVAAKKKPKKPEKVEAEEKDKAAKAKVAKKKPKAAPKKKPARAAKTKKDAAETAPEVKAAEIKKEAATLKPAPKARPARTVPARIYMKPTLRKTARAPEGEPLPIPGQTPLTRVAEAAKEAPPEPVPKKKKKKKKKGKAGEQEAEPVAFEEAAPKKRLRRKIAFKIQSGIEGMEIADVEQMYMPSRKKITSKKKIAQKTQITIPKAAKRIIRMGQTITAADLARQLGVKSQQIIKSLKAEGIDDSEIKGMDADTASIIASAYNYEIVQDVFDEKKILGHLQNTPQPEKLKSRPPVVTVMGHVDHGKTSLLDTIRKTKVTEEEVGQITQRIGASVVETSSGKIVFVDTPGHEAFTVMRARGAKVTDIVVLVVAADDGIMPQTIEAADHAKAAGVPIILAINKIDLPNTNPQAIKQRLSEIDLTPEEWGGETLVVECSAKTGKGIPELLEAILLQAEMLELTADPDRPGKGFVIESWLDKGRGPVATIIVQEGVFKKGDVILSGFHYGKIRAMLDDRGKAIDTAGPSTPVEITGLSNVPEPGEVVMAVDDERKAKLVAEHRLEEQKRVVTPIVAPAKVSLEDLMARLAEGEVQNLNLILKTDAHGSAEAVKQSVENLSKKEVQVQVIQFGVGNVTENDVLLASASKAVVIGFAVKTEANAKKLAEREGVQIRSYDIIYDLVDDIEASLKGMLKPVFEEKVIGKAEVRKIFQISKVGAVAGSYVMEGTIKRSANARVLRGSEVVFSGKFKSLKRLQDDVREVNQGLECGIGIDNFNDVQEGDIIEAYELTEVAP